MTLIIKHSYQKGFSILAVILVIVAVIAVISIWVLSGQTNSNSTGNSTADVQAAAIINDGAAIKLAFDTLVVNGTLATAVTFVPNTAGSTNMLDPTTGIQIPKANVNAIRLSAGDPEAIWVYNGTTFTGNTIGTTSADQAILLAGIKDTVCGRINYALYGSTFIPSLSTTNVSSAYVTVATSTAPTTTASVDLNHLYSGGIGWLSGCVGSNGYADQNVYFRILKAN